MFSDEIGYPLLYERLDMFAICLAVVSAVSLGLLFLARWRALTAILAAVASCAWIVLLLPDLGGHFTPPLSPDMLWCPAPRHYYIPAYALILLPAVFVVFGIHALWRRTHLTGRSS